MTRLARRAGAVLGLTLALGSAAQAREATFAYVIQPGDTLYGLAQRGLNRLDDYRIVQSRNRIAEPRRLRVGARLIIPVRLLRTEPVEARLGAFRGQLTVTSGGKATSATRGAVLRAGDSLATGPNAFGRLDLPDGSRLTLPSQSRIRIVRLQRTVLTGGVAREFMVEEGAGDSLVRPLRNPNDSYIVRTPMSVSAVRGTEFRVRYAAQHDRASTEVLEGAVEVQSGTTRAVVPRTYGLLSSVDGEAVSAPLPPAPVLRGFGGLQDEPSLAFDVEPPAAPRVYHAQLAADAGFVEVIGDVVSDLSRVTFDTVDDGVYFVRVSLIDPEGLESLPSTYAFERRLNALTPRAPARETDGPTRRYLFRWDVEGAGERTYRFQLRREGAEGLPMVDETGLTDQRITLTDLPRGVYVWRVMSRTLLRGRLVEKWSAEQRFENGV
ncbi:MAG: peptigoglycan-binding protein LysM [Phenylobacterium zucineum]|nr:MAG: peptigoglycan-binding protein LysM [Phenylobacterium zucineum]